MPPLLRLDAPALLEIFAALDGASLVRAECATRALRRGAAGPWAGVWRLAHVRALGGRPPTALARAPSDAALAGLGPGGAWKAWWAWRRQAMAEEDVVRRAAAMGLARRLVERPWAGYAPMEAKMEPLTPTEDWLDNLFALLRDSLGTHLREPSDPRFAPLAARWHCHVLTACEAAAANAAGLQDYVRTYASWSFGFGAQLGQPRLFFAVIRISAVAQVCEVGVYACRIAPRPSMSWAGSAAEMVELLCQERGMETALCGASRLLRLELSSQPPWAFRACDLAPTAELAAVARELFGPAQEPVAQALQLLQWLLAATCPHPFGEGPGALQAASAQLAQRFEEA